MRNYHASSNQKIEEMSFLVQTICRNCEITLLALVKRKVIAKMILTISQLEMQILVSILASLLLDLER